MNSSAEAVSTGESNLLHDDVHQTETAVRNISEVIMYCVYILTFK